jgi:hypothetical protein
MSDGDLPAWPLVRAALHEKQGVPRLVGGWAESLTDGGEPTLSELIDHAIDGYRSAFRPSQLVEFDDHGATYLFDQADDPSAGRTARVVAAWGYGSASTRPRDRSRQAGFPLSAARSAAGYDRGHLLAHAVGGGLDENLFPQASHVNQGRSRAGQAYRKLEGLAQRHLGCLIFHRLIYGDGTDVPDLTQLTIGLPAATHSGTFDNRPVPVSSSRLLRGQQFHRRVQTAFLSDLIGASAHPEHTLRLGTGRRRVDLLVLPRKADEHVVVVVEVKNTEWDAFRADRVRPNLRRHIRQLQEYLDYYVDQLRTSPQGPADRTGDGDTHLEFDSVIGVLLYPTRPACARLIDSIALDRSLTVVWYDETDWRG